MDYKNENLNFLYKLSWEALLLPMIMFKSTNPWILLNAVKDTLRRFEYEIGTIPSRINCIEKVKLEEMGILKKKHYVFGTYLATLSSYPILNSVMEHGKILDSIFAKTSAITSIKLLDNLNDRIHSREMALTSLNKYLDAFTKNDFTFNEEDDWISRAENVAYSLARLTYDTLKRYVLYDSNMFKVYVMDFTKLINGQVKSLTQKVDDEKGFINRDGISIYTYITQINEKGVGSIWLDIDFCLLEAALDALDSNEVRAVEEIKTAMDYILKATNIYDDVADMAEDFSCGILNSVPLLAVDQGYISTDELTPGGGLMEKLMRSPAVEDTLYLGDLIFLKGIRHMHNARYSGHIDIDALVFGTRILRAFCVRKLLLRGLGVTALRTALRSFKQFKNYRIPDHILQYEKAIEARDGLFSKIIG